jgi:UDP-N-acetyl-D-glucosamine dehydrogenase
MEHSRAIESVGIVGLGYVGLPLAVAFSGAGLPVVGVDSDERKVVSLENGASYIEDIPDEAVRTATSGGRFVATTDYSRLREVEAVLICLPTPLNENREPDLSILVSGIESVARNLRENALVVLESTTYPGTTREVLLPILEREGRRVGRDFHLAFSPERVDPGNRKYTLKNTPKVVGGITGECVLRAEALYSRVSDEIHAVSSPESAEMSKLLENVFRGVNIALVNELAILCDRMGVDVWEVIEAASTKPFGFMSFYPGPGLGGHCIPVDPFYLSWRARAYDMNAEFIELAGRVNVNMPYHALGRIASALNSEEKAVKGSRILLLGMSYKPNVGDIRESPSLKILDLLLESGARAVYHDPYVPDLPKRKLSSVEITRRALESADCVVIATDHASVDLELVVEAASKVVDLRNAVRKRLGGRLPANVEVL